MAVLKLARLPRGTNRNRTLRRPAAGPEDIVVCVAVEQLFRRFWQSWQKQMMRERQWAAAAGPAPA